MLDVLDVLRAGRVCSAGWEWSAAMTSAMEERMLAQGWSRARIAEVLGSAREPEPEPEPEGGGPRSARMTGSSRRPRPPGQAKASPRQQRHAAMNAALEAKETGLEPGIQASPKARRRSAAAAAAAAASPRRLDGGGPEQDLSQLGPRARRRAQAAAAVEDARRNRQRDRNAAKKAGPITVAPPSQEFTPSGKRLTPASVYLRIRPLAAEGGHADGEAVRKQLDSWTDTTVTIVEEFMFSKGEAEYRFPKKVFGPEVDQDGVWEGAGGPELVDQFTRFGGHNVIYFAYGQTGAGKTHTMLGTDESLWAPLDGGDAVDPGWGIFPRACFAIFETMEKSGRTYQITASAVEFYMCECLDLLEPDPEVKLQVDASTHSVCGAKRITLSKMADLLPFLEQVQMNRTTRSTAMNRADGEHGGSSRSHAALILTLTQLDDSGDSVATTTFTLMDLVSSDGFQRTEPGVLVSTSLLSTCRSECSSLVLAGGC